jgi:hypothetical protein
VSVCGQGLTTTRVGSVFGQTHITFLIFEDHTNSLDFLGISDPDKANEGRERKQHATTVAGCSINWTFWTK